MAATPKEPVTTAGPFNGLLTWVDARFPLMENWRSHLSEYYAPKNFNFWYYMGSLALLVLVMQIVTGIFLTMHYKPDAAQAFASVEYIMREVSFGWLVRYMHSTGASLFFLVVYLHMFRGLLFGTGPFIGPDLSEWIRGDYVISDATLNRFFAFHVIALPLVLLGLVAAHILALHEVGSNNPDGIEIKKNLDAKGKPVDGIPFHPYYTVKDAFGAAVFLFVFAIIVFFAPEVGGYFLEANNFIPADPLKTPLHIAPVWYFTPYYSILRAIPPLFNSQFPGVAAMGAATMILFVLPWLDRSPVKSIRYRGPIFKRWVAAFVVAFLILGYLGTEPTNVWGQFGAWLGNADRATVVARIGTAIYFLFFFMMPWYSKIDKCKPEPERVTW